MCHNIKQNLDDYQRALSEENTTSGRNHVKRFCLYCLITFGYSAFATTVVAIADLFFATDFYYCLRLQFDAKNYAFLPVLLVMAYGVIIFAQTKARINQIGNDTPIRTNSYQGRVSLEKMR